MGPSYIFILLYLTVVLVVARCPARCKCVGEINISVNCRHKGLKWVPKGLPSNTVELNLALNYIESIRTDDFTGLKRLKSLDLSDNHIGNFSSNAFSLIPQLEVFIFNHNPYPHNRINKDILCPLRQAKVTELHISGMKFGRNFTFLFDCLTKLSLKSLYLGYNYIGPLSDYVFTPLRNIKKLELTNTNQTQFNTMAYANLTELDNLGLSKNNLQNFPSFINKHGYPILPKIKVISFAKNQLTSIGTDDFKGLETLQYLTLSYNNIYVLGGSTFSRLINLTSLKLSHNRLYKINQYSFKSKTLTNLDLSKISSQVLFFKLDNRWINPLQYVPNLEKLFLNEMRLKSFVHEVPQFLGCLIHLQFLSMVNTALSVIPNELFSKLYQLKRLDLSGNGIRQVTSPKFKYLVSLRMLMLDGNRIPYINQTSFPQHFEAHLIEVSLAGNPFQCDCNLLWFLQWIKKTNVTIIGFNNRGAYKCASPPALHDTMLVNFKLHPEDCIDKFTTMGMFLSITVSVLSVFVLISVVVIYRYRWYCRYCYFFLRARVKQYKVIFDETEYQYDGFVCYNSNEIKWIKDIFLPKVEDEAGFHVCIHDRDWLPGPDIVDNLIQSIHNSRKTILIVSNAFAKSQWCQLELTMAQHRLFEEDKNNLILILMEDIDPENMTPRLALQMRRKTFIQWSNDHIGQKLFWKKLVRSLSKPDTSFRHELH